MFILRKHSSYSHHLFIGSCEGHVKKGKTASHLNSVLVSLELDESIIGSLSPKI